MKEDYHQKGMQDYEAWISSKQYAQFDRNTDPKIVMKLFLPVVQEDTMMVSRPLPHNHLEWLRGFDAAAIKRSAQQ